MAKPENVIRVTKAACVLHNFLQRSNNTADANDRQYCPDGFTDAYDENEMIIYTSFISPSSSKAERIIKQNLTNLTKVIAAQRINNHAHGNSS